MELNVAAAEVCMCVCNVHSLFVYHFLVCWPFKAVAMIKRKMRLLITNRSGASVARMNSRV